MTPAQKDALWRKAAVLGSLWAASEIVLGSFLHNAHVPLAGHLLTGIGVIILVAGHRLWPERGLLWRAGLVCAVMKSVSPSAVIMGPMIAIAMEAFLLEAGVFLAGATPVGYLLGGGLAMSWPFLHQTGNLVIMYGTDTVAVYLRGLEQVRAWTGLRSANPWTPLAILGAAHFLGGSLAAALGLRVGREAPARTAASPSRLPAAPRPQPAEARAYSLTALALHAAFVIAAMSLGHKVSLAAWFGVCIAYAAVCAWAYPRVAKKLKRFGLWSSVLAVAVLAGLLLGRWQAGLRMGLRAILLTLAFACIGVELRNPRLRAWMERRGGRIFFDALELAFDTLPGVLAGLPSGAELLRRPVECLRAAISAAPDLLAVRKPGRVFFITGESGSGKSKMVAALADSLRQEGASVGGLHAPGFWEGGRRGGFDLVDLLTSERRPLCRTEGPRDWTALGPFRFSPDGIAFGQQALDAAGRRDVDVLMVDEVGYLELQGQGWARQLDTLAFVREKPMVWVVRESLVEEVRKRWGLADVRIARAGTAEQARELLAELRRAPAPAA